jgi:hypothetical protein
MNQIDLNLIITKDYKICHYKKSPDCIKLGPKDQFNKGRCCLKCLSILNTEYYHKHQEKYQKKALENKQKHKMKNLVEENNVII